MNNWSGYVVTEDNDRLISFKRICLSEDGRNEMCETFSVFKKDSVNGKTGEIGLKDFRIY